MHSEAIGSVWTFSKNFEIFWIFESFFNVSGRNFYKRLFSRHNMAIRNVQGQTALDTASAGAVANTLQSLGARSSKNREL